MVFSIKSQSAEKILKKISPSELSFPFKQGILSNRSGIPKEGEKGGGSNLRIKFSFQVRAQLR
jgi:hypothetical protein